MRLPVMTLRPRSPLAFAAVAQVLIATVSLVAALSIGWKTQWWGSDVAAMARVEPSSAEVTALLKKHAAALRGRDRSAFAADLDNGAVSRDYRNAQLSAFDNMAQVPLGSWDLSVESMVPPDQATTEATGRLSAPARIAKVQLTYGLEGIDPAPTQHSLWLTFVRRGNNIRIASDSDLADEAGKSWKGPWDFGPVVVARGKASIVLAHPSSAAQLTSLTASVDSAVAAVTSLWGTNWPRKVAVFVPDNQDETSQVIGQDLDLDRIAAASIADVNEPQNKLFLGQRVVVNPLQLSKLSDVGRQIVITHEVALIATRPSVGPELPFWLIEGFAEYVANLNTNQSVPTAAAELKRDVQAGTLPAALPTAQDFYTYNIALPQTYEQAWLACRLIAERVGAAGLVTFIKTVSDATQAIPPMSADDALASALTSQLGLTTAEFIALWVSYLRQLLG